MTSPSDVIGGEPMPSPAAGRHRSGPWLITHGDDAESADAAQASAAQARAAGIVAHVHPIEDVPAAIESWNTYPGFVMILPVPLGQARTRAMARAYRTAMYAYRGAHPRNLADLLTGNLDFCDVGTIQLVVPPPLQGHSALRELVQGACCTHTLGPDLDLIKPYENQPLGLAAAAAALDPTADRDAEIAVHIRRLRAWGLTDPGELAPLVAGVEAQLRRVNAAKNRLSEHRPLGNDDPRNALQLIMAGHSGADFNTRFGTKDQKAMFAKVQRDVVTALKRVNPELTAPCWTDRTPELGRFINSLKTVNLWVRYGGRTDWSPMDSSIRKPEKGV